MPVSLRAVLEREFDAAERRLRQAAGWKSDDRVEGVHEFRRAVKRLRAAVSIAAAQVGEREWKAVDRGLAGAARRLGGLRDAHARCSAAQRLVRLLPRSTRAVGMDAWRAAGGSVTEAAAEPSAVAVHRLLQASAGELEGLRHRVATWSLEGMDRAGVIEAVSRAWSRARDRFRASWDGRDGEWLHGARKRAQRCASMLLLVQGWDGRALRDAERRLRQAASLLGEARDAELMLACMPEPTKGDTLWPVTRRWRSAIVRHAATCLRRARREGLLALAEGRGELRRRLRRRPISRG
jgi:CHAD domain-containing protein